MTIEQTSGARKSLVAHNSGVHLPAPEWNGMKMKTERERERKGKVKLFILAQLV